MLVDITKDEADFMLDWAKSAMQADLDSYANNEQPWDISKKECKKIWLSLIKKLRLIIKNG